MVNGQMTMCTGCKGLGGFGTFGACESNSIHYKGPCSTCNGRGYIPQMVQFSIQTPPVTSFVTPSVQFVHQQPMSTVIVPPAPSMTMNMTPPSMTMNVTAPSMSMHMNNMGPSFTGQWNKIDGKLTSISVNSKAIYGVNQNNQIWRRAHNSNSWVQLPGAACRISSGAKDEVWVVNSKDEIYRYLHHSNSWTKMPGALVEVAVAGPGNVWGVNRQQQIWMWNGQWKQMPGAAVKIGVTKNGTAWVVNSKDEIFRWNGMSWDKMPGALTQISCGTLEDDVVGVNKQHQIWKWTGSTWIQLPGEATWTSAWHHGKHKRTVCCNKHGDIYHM